ncbi:hypothetical protein Q6A51_13295 [Pseudomonas sp. KFB-139]|uniref:Uncharacterized protein n=1 Tax=Pseudomonas serbiensis TaxID=3064350 RepID=A0ABT9CQJ1_9PSED|nr:hypothetical protein [Pseudomonas sp. KFB-138]MDO7927765.1 hypothetical protein [Pseudomonas sp. KFB-138]
MSDSPEKKAAIARLLELEQILAAAEKDLADWQDYDYHRSDGSMRQDQMHEEEGRRLRDAVYHARQAVEAQKLVIAKLP